MYTLTKVNNGYHLNLYGNSILQKIYFRRTAHEALEILIALSIHLRLEDKLFIERNNQWGLVI